MQARVLIRCLSIAAFAACSACDSNTISDVLPDAEANGPPDSGVVPRDAGELEDAGGNLDAAVIAQCPPPAVLTPAEVPGGYLAAEVVGYRSTTDGDTAHFIFDTEGEQIIRLLYVNTEESHGSATTAFGEATEDLVRGWNAAAREIVVAVREEPRSPGQPDLDPYDRWLGLVFLDGVLLETRLIQEGLSAYYTKFGCAPEPLHTAFVNAESEARENHRGIWREGHPTDYEPIIEDWIPSNDCRPNPFVEPYCP